MSENGQWTDAVVTKIEPENHAGCYFEFFVDLRKYSGSGVGCSDYGVGSSIRVMYFPENPAFSTTKAPRDELMFLILGPILMALLCGLMVYARNRDELP